MVRGLLLWAAGNPRLERTITENSIFGTATHRSIAGEKLDEALQAAAELNARAWPRVSRGSAWSRVRTPSRSS